MITAPYNFVPLNKEIFYPDWADQVSHDIPFSDGESGEIEVTITAKSPIFIRNHSSDKDNPSQEFCNHNGTYYIPGSSVKGMVRNVLEIMSFSKISIDEKEHSKKMGVRDMTNNELVGKATGTDKSFGYGLLEKDKNGKYELFDYGSKIRLILQSELAHIKYSRNLGNKKKVSEKYNNKKGGIYPFTKLRVSIDTNNNPGGNKHFHKYVVKFESNINKGEIGELFFNGDFPYGRTAKHYEFILLESDKNANKNNNYTLTDEVVKGFKNIYLDDKESDVGQFWKAKDKIPVFYAVKNKQITDLGLTQVYKKAYKKTILEASWQDTQSNRLDLAETIFGTEKEDMALKGRVQFSHLKSNTVYGGKIVKEEILNSPKPTYYPNYIKQTKTKGNKVQTYITLMDNDAKISGWKRYPLRNKIKDNNNEDNKDKLTTKFKPLDKETTFIGKIRFHNLKKAEIGALLSAITFHGKSDTHHHNIGMAKPLGYGKIKIDLSLKDLKHTKEEYLQSFEDEITKEIPKWKDSPQLKELFAMCDKDTNNDEKLIYQLLDNQKPKYFNKKGFPIKNDFVGAKEYKEYLVLYSHINKEPQKPKPKRRGLIIVKKKGEN